MGETRRRQTEPQPQTMPRRRTDPRPRGEPRPRDERRRRRFAPAVGWALLVALAGMLIALTSSPRPVGGLAPPADRFAHGAAGTARNGHGGEIAASPTIRSWPGTAAGGNGGPFAFVGAQYGSRWNLPTGLNNRLGVGYCVMEDVRGEGAVSRRPDPAEWSAGEMARAAALMSTFGGDRVVPYGIHAPAGQAVGDYDVTSGEWQHPLLWGGGEYTRRRQVAVNFGVRMFLEDVSPHGAARGRKLARDSAVVAGSGGEYPALRNGYLMARRMASSADVQAAVGGVHLELRWQTPGGTAPTRPGRYRLQVRVQDATGKAVGWVPVVQLSGTGIDGVRSTAAAASAASIGPPSSPARVRHEAAVASGWPTWNMGKRLVTDPRFAVGDHPDAATVADRDGIARFDVDITAGTWEIGFHVQAPTADVELHAGTGIQGQATWAGRPQSASAGEAVTPPPASTTTTTTTTTVPPTTVPPSTVTSTTVTSTTVTSTTNAPSTTSPSTTLPPTTPPPTTTSPSTTLPPTTPPPTTLPTTTSPPTATMPTSTIATATTVPVNPAPPTTTVKPTTTMQPTTTVQPTTTEPPAPGASPPELPRTGSGSGRLAWWAAVVLLTGVGAVLNAARPDDGRRG